MKKEAISTLSILMYVLAACKPFPKDPNDTLEGVQNKVLKVGLSAYDSTANTSARSIDFEISLAKQFAEELNAKIEWVRGPQSEIVELLHYNNLHMAIGGYTSPSPFEKKVSFSRPYLINKIMVGTGDNQAVPENIKGEKVVVGDHLAALYVRKKGGIPVFTDSLSRGNYLIAASEDELIKMNVKPTNILLHKEKFVIAVPKGENAFLIKLEHFIDRHGRAKE